MEPAAVRSHPLLLEARQHVCKELASAVAVLGEVCAGHRHEDLMPVAQASIDMQARPLHALDVFCLGVRVARVRELALVSTINDDADRVCPASKGKESPS